MRLTRAVGLGIFLLTLSLAMPRVFRALEETALSGLGALQTTFEKAESISASPATLLIPRVSP